MPQISLRACQLYSDYYCSYCAEGCDLCIRWILECKAVNARGWPWSRFTVEGTADDSTASTAPHSFHFKVRLLQRWYHHQLLRSRYGSTLETGRRERDEPAPWFPERGAAGA